MRKIRGGGGEEFGARDVVRAAFEVVWRRESQHGDAIESYSDLTLPVPRFPEPIPIHLGSIRSHGRIGICE